MEITDRSKDVIKSGGEWISSITLENIAVSHPDVIEAAVIAATHTKWDERPLLLVVPRPGHTVDPASVLALYEGKVAKWWRPDEVLVVDGFAAYGDRQAAEDQSAFTLQGPLPEVMKVRDTPLHRHGRRRGAIHAFGLPPQKTWTADPSPISDKVARQVPNSVVVGEGRPSTTCGVDGDKAVNGGPSPTATWRGRRPAGANFSAYAACTRHDEKRQARRGTAAADHCARARSPSRYDGSGVSARRA